MKILSVVFLISLVACSSSNAQVCNGAFSQSESTNAGTWKWTYSAGSISVSGETLIRHDGSSFSIIGKEDTECAESRDCSTMTSACAVSHALRQPISMGLQSGRIQISSYSIYENAIRSAKGINKCEESYARYYRNIESFWRESLVALNADYAVSRVYPREINLTRPQNIKEYGGCFGDSSGMPTPWHGMDFFPVIEVSR